MDKKSRNKKYWEENKEKISLKRKSIYSSLSQSQKKSRINDQKNWRDKNRDKYLLMLRKSHLKSKYGITIEEYNKKIISQNGCCEICGNKQDDRNLFVDHNHETGEIRDLLCLNCNFIIGHSYENIEILKKCIDYIDKYK